VDGVGGERMGTNISTQKDIEVNGRQKALFLQSTVHTEKPTGRPNCKKPKILIVDDEEDLCEILAQVLRENGYLADMTFTVSEAIEKIRNTRYELMITDMRLPDRSGIELLERAKKISPHTVVIILTAFPETETAVTALNNGAFSYLTKPFSNKGLLGVVDTAFAKQKS
jgi:two-component system response regulator HydG